jgi:hypothetical protein
VRSENTALATMDGEEVESSSVAIVDVATSMTAVDRAAIDAQVATAKQYPRSVTQSLRDARTLATLDEETAASMLYALKRGGKVLEGPSVRLAEIMLYSWGNMRAETDIVGEDNKAVTAMGTCMDLEKNVAVRTRVKRRITDKNGRKYNDDMVVTTGNAASSIALRNAVFKVIPRALVDQVYREARKASLGQGGTMTQKRQNAIAWFTKAGATEAQVFTLIGVKGMDDIGEDHLIQLRGLRNTIQAGEQSIEDMLRPESKSEAVASLNAALGNGGAKTKAISAPAPTNGKDQPLAPDNSPIDDSDGALNL